MPSTKTTLTSCYTPTASSSQKHLLISKSLSTRPDGSGNPNQTRTSNSIRRLCLDRSILSSSTGSSLIELGHTKVICSVHGPRPATSSSLISATGKKEFHSKGILNCELRYAPMFGIKPETRVETCSTNLDGYSSIGAFSGGSSGTNISAQEIELSSRLHDAISPSIPLDLLMKSVVDVFIMVLQDDGSVFAASVIAASLALSDAGVEIYDCVTACSVAVVPRSLVVKSGKEDVDENDDFGDNFYLLVDPVEHEILAAEGVVTLAFMSNWKEVTFWDQTGCLPPKVASEAAEMCRDGCKIMSKFMRKCLIGSSSSKLA